MIRAKIIDFDGSGSCILDIDQKNLIMEGILLGDAVGITMRDDEMLSCIPVLSGYYCKAHETLLLVSSKGCELAVKRGDARAQYRFEIGDELAIELESPKKYWEQENAYSFCEIIDEGLYSDREKFANFRPLFNGGTSFFRSASPFDDTYGRARVVQSCIGEYSIRTIIDVADTPEELSELMKAGAEHPASTVVYAVGDDAGLYSEEYKCTIVQAIEIIIREDGPFLLHCRAGKRRSGFLCALLQGLSGVNYPEVVADYMMSYANNNGITRASNPQRFDYLRKDTIEKFLTYIGVGEDDELPACIERYLKTLGISQTTIFRLKAKLAEDKSPR